MNRSSLPQASAKAKGSLGYRLLAISAVGAGGLGVILPLLPTTPFILIALWATARGAPEWHERIRTHPRFGPSVQAWRTQRAVSSRAKWLACSMMAVSWLGLWLSDVHSGILAALAVLFVAVATYLVARPEPAESS